VLKAKTGKNAPCPCGSKKKYKKCCIQKEEGLSIVPIPAEVHTATQAKIRAEQVRRQQFGEGRPIIEADYNGYKFVAVGSKLHYSNKWKMFPDFLMDYVKRILGTDWGKSELAKPIEERHVIMKWYDTMCRFQQKQIKGSDGLFDAVPCGAMRAYLLLSYDLYILQHNSALQNSIIRRLKHKDQFQGARHELFAAATCIRAGYDIAFENETDPSKKHTEFLAVHKTTKQEISVEAKSRHRPGILGYPGTPMASNKVKAGISRLLKDAFDKPASQPYVIFFDLNLPPSPDPLFKKPWFHEIEESVDRVAKKREESDCFNLIVFSNQPDYYSERDNPSSPSDVFSILSQNPRNPASHQSAIVAIHEAANKYGTIPNFFQEAS